MSDHHSAAATEDDNLGRPPPSSTDLESQPLLLPSPQDSAPATLPLSAFFPFFLLLAGAALSVVATVTLILNVETGYELDFLHVSSFHIINNSSLTAWDAVLSINRSERGFFEDPDVAYEARSWLYSRSGFVFVSSPSMNPGGGGGELFLRSNFTMPQVEEEAVARDGILILDLLIEANATARGSSGSGTASYLMIECSELEIEFAANRSFGALSGDGGAKRCGVQVYPSKFDALKGSRILDTLRRLFYYLSFRRDRSLTLVY